jgi:DNA-directed RNA polymerase subunit E'/Rpb7
MLKTSVTLKPHQMDNQIYKHLKSNLKEKLEGKCYKNYGYISKIINIIEYTSGHIVPENPLASAIYNIKFTCRLCYPIAKRSIICKVANINKMFINAQNGPITIVITMDRINTNIFFQDQATKKLMISDNSQDKKKKKTEIAVGMLVKVLISSVSHNDNDRIIMALGELENIVSDEEKEKYYNEEFVENVENNITNYEDYITEKDIENYKEDVEDLQEEQEEESKEHDYGDEGEE